MPSESYPFDLSIPNPGPIPFPLGVEVDRIRRIHVVGVAGTGMGAFAGLLQQAGYEVTGSDENVYPPMSEKLPEWGIRVLSPFGPANLDTARPDLVVIGNVIRKVNPEATAVRERGLPHVSFPAALGRLFLQDRESVVVAGTHGKTTTTTLLAQVFTAAGRDPSFLVGGVPRNFDESFHVGRGRQFVVEGDEYDTVYFDKGPKFWHYRPHRVQFTGAEFDHADIYRDMDHYESSFRRLFGLIPPDGLLVACTTFPNTIQLVTGASCPVVTYTARDGVDADVRAVGISADAHGTRFRLESRVPLPEGSDGPWLLPLWGLHNVENAVGAVVLALRSGLSATEVAAGLATFAGVRRRQELVVRAGGVDLVDDFAHHPTAVRETIAATLQRFPGRRVWAVFEPRSNTASRAIHRTAYAEAFDGAHAVVLATPRKIDGLQAEERLDVEGIVADIGRRGPVAHVAADPAQIAALVLAEVRRGDVVLVMSNGAFGGLVPRLRQGLLDRAAEAACG